MRKKLKNEEKIWTKLDEIENVDEIRKIGIDESRENVDEIGKIGKIDESRENVDEIAKIGKIDEIVKKKKIRKNSRPNL